MYINLLFCLQELTRTKAKNARKLLSKKIEAGKRRRKDKHHAKENLKFKITILPFEPIASSVCQQLKFKNRLTSMPDQAASHKVHYDNSELKRNLINIKSFRISEQKATSSLLICLSLYDLRNLISRSRP